MKHDAATVHAFVSRLISYVKEELQGLNKLIYVGNRAASHYKFFTNVCHHKSDYILAAEWHVMLPAIGRVPVMV